MKKLQLVLACSALVAWACVSDHKRAPTAQEVAEGEALPPAPPVPPQSASPNDAAPTPASPASDDGKRADMPPTQETLSEAQMAKVSDLVNNAEVAQGQLAQRKAKNAAVKAFASKMVKHHEQALREQAKLVKKLNVTLADSPTATSLKADGDKTLQSLEASDAAGFDALYVKSQIDGHQKALDLLDNLLIPAAKTPEVADALRKGRAIVAQHLEEARALPTK